MGLDLLNKNVGINYATTSSYIQEEQVNTLGRYLMLRFVYNLSGLSRRPGGVELVGQ